MPTKAIDDTNAIDDTDAIGVIHVINLLIMYATISSQSDISAHQHYIHFIHVNIDM